MEASRGVGDVVFKKRASPYSERFAWVVSGTQFVTIGNDAAGRLQRHQVQMALESLDSLKRYCYRLYWLRVMDWICGSVSCMAMADC